MNLLSIHYFFPPKADSGSVRNFYLTSALAHKSDKSFVITHANDKKSIPVDCQLPDNLEVITIESTDYKTLIRQNHFAEEKKENSFFQFLSKLKKTLPFQFLVGEGGLIYAYRAYQAAKRIIVEEEINVIYSSFSPYIDHLIAYFLKSEFPAIKWVADFRDLHIDPTYKDIYLKDLNEEIEKRILKKANLLTTVSEGYRSHLEKYGKSLAIPRGIEIRQHKPVANNVFKIAYTGNLYRDFRKGNTVVAAIKNFIHTNSNAAVEFHYAGRDGGKFKSWFSEEGLEHIFLDHGLVSRKEALNLQVESDLLILLTSNSEKLKGVLTGKLFEYIESKKPILTHINGVYDEEFESLFSRLNLGLVAYNDGNEEMSNFIKHIYLSKMNGQEWEINEEEIREKESWSGRAKKILNHLDV